MRIATWNINGLRARLDYLALWLEDRQPDLVGLQELKLDDPSFPHRELESLGYQATVHGQKSWNGVAILSRSMRAFDVERGLLGQEDLGSRLLSARFVDPSDGGLGEFEFCTVYCPNGKHLAHADFQLKLDWYEALILRQSARSVDHQILCGDFNLCPDSLDSWSEDLLAGGIFHTEDERTRFQRLLATGLEDLYRVVEPEGNQFSWWDYRAGAFHKNQGLRIDFLLGSRGVAGRAAKVWTDRDYRKKKDGMIASDHAPVIVDVDA